MIIKYIGTHDELGLMDDPVEAATVGGGDREGAIVDSFMICVNVDI
jgi:hypothetical protein